MAGRVRSLLDWLRSSDHTGDNRCLPCTTANVLIAAAASAIVAVAGSIELGALSFVGAGAVIGVRGYLVPGTPVLTERLLPDRVLAAFEKGPTAPDSAGDDTRAADASGGRQKRIASASDPTQFLADRGVVEPCERRQGQCLAGAFADRLREQTERRDDVVDNDAVAALFGAAPDTVEVEYGDHPEVSVGYRHQIWPSRAALVADVAGHEALAGHVDGWASVPREQRLAVLRSLRSYQERCPRCGGPVSRSSSPAESCCRSYDVVTVGCVDCGDALLELDPTVVDGESPSGVSDF